ncbi:MAG: hypothetical protein JJLCMIEE_03170 [Acidimicrobiales bacterium]|nr:MAG: DUF4365 domain-containing protein [Actinomycetota bacterium]MBV6510051.1 hypothetical protein [Acidimicrobiales bacterium]RIK04249.1 MAG: hypothetical protein DCC48_14265 [Acidobacteriota bacterium]
MAELPRVTETDFTERTGINFVASTVNSARCIWRETLERDIGIDGHIEYVTPEGFAPGRIVGAQVKSGESRFSSATEVDVPFSPEEKHRRYWAEYPLPVILVLHRPETKETIWVDARHHLRVHGLDATIRAPIANVLDEAGVLTCLTSDGPLPSGAFDPTTVLHSMAQKHEAAQGLCFLYLFAQGMTDIANAIYFSMDVVDEILDVVSATWTPPIWGVGPAEYKFIDEYVEFLVANDLARVDFGSWKQALVERQMVGKFIAPLTAKGRQVRDLIAAIDDELPPSGDPYARAVRERFVQMVYNPTGHDETASRQYRIEEVRLEIERRAG